jgi:very-short-patch-repair endonuclease
MKITLNAGDNLRDFIYVGDSITLGEFSARKLPFKCKCGRISDRSVSSITSGRSRSCGRCNEIYLNDGDEYLGFVYVGEGQALQPGTTDKLLFKCKCGKSKFLPVVSITTGHTKTCGECDNIIIRTGDRFQNLEYIGNDVEIAPGSGKKVPFKCACGKLKQIRLRSVLKDKQKTCGDCGSITLKKFSTYGDFEYIGDDIEIGPWSKTKLEFKCKCGNTKLMSILSITSGDNTSCGDCYDKIFKWYEQNEDKLRSLKGNVIVSLFPSGGLTPLEEIKGVVNKFRAMCPICGDTFKPSLSDVKRGRSLTCGCVNNKISKPNREIASFIRNHGTDVKLEFMVGDTAYDICVPSRKIIIEFNGLKWHSFDRSKVRDAEKYDNAKRNGYDILCIYEDEWRYKNSIIKSIILNRIGVNSEAVSLRPKECEIKIINAASVAKLYETHHYIGSDRAPINYGIYFGSELIGAASFKKPSRKSKHDYELSRMVMNRRFKVHGIWNKILKLFVQSYGGKSIVSFSDNRLFTGKVYDLMGFKNDGLVKPDYYWTKSRRRFHKSALRKTKEEIGTGKSESELRMAQGFRKIWDLGKTRWIYKCE